MLKIGESGQTVKSEHFYNESDDTTVIKYQADTESVIDANKAAQGDFRRFGNEAFHHVAEIPAVLIVKWLVEENINFYKPEGFEYIVKKKLNDPEYQYLKTIPGRI